MLVCLVWCGQMLLVVVALVGVCARAPSRISVRDPGWLGGGEMMVDGVIPLG